jgi:hypothetical protein
MKAKLKEGIIYRSTPTIKFEFTEVPPGGHWGMKILYKDLWLEGSVFELEYRNFSVFSHFNNSLYKIYRGNDESKT